MFLVPGHQVLSSWS